MMMSFTCLVLEYFPLWWNLGNFLRGLWVEETSLLRAHCSKRQERKLWVLRPKWNIYTNFSPMPQGTLRKKGWKECKSERLRRSALKCHLLGITGSLHLHIHSRYGCFHKTWNRLKLVKNDSMGVTVWSFLIEEKSTIAGY